MVHFGVSAVKAGKTYAEIAEYLVAHDSPKKTNGLTSEQLLQKVRAEQRINELIKVFESFENSKQDFLFNIGITLFPPISLLICGVGLFRAASGFVQVQKDRTP